MKKEKLLPDLGAFSRTLARPDAKHTFLRVLFGSFSRVSENLFTASSQMPVGRKRYLGSFDFPVPAFKHLVEELPAPMIEALRGLTMGEFTTPRTVKLPALIRATLTTRLGKPTSSSTGESFIPLVVLKVDDVEVLPIPKPRGRRCPSCKSPHVLELVYGHPPPSMWDPPAPPGLVSGGCIVEADSPGRVCADCNARWGHPTF